VEVAEKLVSRLREISARSGVNVTILFELFSTRKVLSVPNDATAHIRGSRASVLLLALWTDKDATKLDAARNATAELSRIIIEGEKIIPESINIGYGNYSKLRRPSTQKPVCSYRYIPDSEEITSAAGTVGTGAKVEVLFGENYARLQKLKKEYDPDLVFFKWSPITPAA